MKTPQSRKRSSRRNPRKGSSNASEVPTDNGECHVKKGKRFKSDDFKGDSEEVGLQDGFPVDEEKDLYQDVLDLFPSVELDCCPLENPVVPGTAVVLHGIILHETTAGLIVLNVRWRKRIFSGALIDIEKNRCAVQRIRPDPPSLGDSKKYIPIKKLKLPTGEASVAPIARPSTPGSLIDNHSPLEKVAGRNLKTSGKCAKRLVAASDSIASVKVDDDSKKVKATEQAYIECHEPNCGKRYKHVNGLKYHRRTAHPPKTEDGSGKDNKSETPEEESDSDGDDDNEDKAASEVLEDMKGTEIKENKKAKCKQRPSKEGDDSCDRDVSSENTEREELTENEKRIEKLRIEAQRASAALQDIIKQEQSLIKQEDDVDYVENDVERSIAEADEQGDMVNLREVQSFSGTDDLTTVQIKQEWCDNDSEPSCGTGSSVVSFKNELHLDSSLFKDPTPLVAKSGEYGASDLESKTAVSSSTLCPPGSGFAQYSAKLSSNLQDITRAGNAFQAPFNSCEDLSVHSNAVHASPSTASLSKYTTFCTSTLTASKEKLPLCPKVSFEIKRIGNKLPEGDFAAMSLAPRQYDKIGLSGKSVDEVVLPSDEERSCSSSPDCPLVGCDKIIPIDDTVDRLKLEDCGVAVIKSEVLQNSLSDPIDPVEALNNYDRGITSDNRLQLDGQGKVRPKLPFAPAHAPQFQAAMGLGPEIVNRLAPVTQIQPQLPRRPSPFLNDLTTGNDIHRMLPGNFSFAGEAGKSQHFSPQLLSILKPASVKIPAESSTGADVIVGESKPLLEKKSSLGVDAILAAGSAKSPISKVPTFLPPNISAGRPLCRTSSTQEGTSSVVVSDACVGSIDQELGSLFSRSLQGKVNMEHMQILPSAKHGLSSLPVRATESLQDGPRGGSYVANGNPLRINPPLQAADERTQIGAKTWIPQEVFVKTSSSADAPLIVPASTLSKVIVSSLESGTSTSLLAVPVLQTSQAAASSAKMKLPSKRPGQPVLIAPAPGPPPAMPYVGLVPAVRPGVAELAPGGPTSPASDLDKSQPQVSRFTLTSDNRLVPSPIENRGRPRKVRVEKTQQIPIGTAQDIERSRGPAEAAVVRKRPPSPIARPSVIQPSSHTAGPSESSSLSPREKKTKVDMPVWTEFRRESTRLPELLSSDGCERPSMVPDPRQGMDARQQQQLQESFMAFASSPANFAGSGQLSAASRLSPPPARLASPRGSDITRQQHALQAPLSSPRLSRASPMNNPYQVFMSSARMEEKLGENVDASRKELSERQAKLMMDIASGGAMADHMRSASQRAPMSPHHPFLSRSSPSPASHFRASLHPSESDNDKSSRDQQYSHFLFSKADGGIRSPVQRNSDLQRHNVRAHLEAVPGFHGSRFSAPINSSFHPRHEFPRSERSLFDRRPGSDDRVDGRPPSVHDSSRYSLHSSAGHHRERHAPLAAKIGTGPPPGPHHSANLVLGRADGAIIRPLSCESRQIDKR